ncbi:hypothetical protein QTP88_029476 [Uroleucon formosanum]
MAKLQSLIPNFLKNTTDIKDFQEVALFYKDILPNYETFDAEIKIWLAKWKNVSDRDGPTTSLTTLQQTYPAKRLPQPSRLPTTAYYSVRHLLPAMTVVRTEITFSVGYHDNDRATWCSFVVH